jgi:hypothetical protein
MWVTMMEWALEANELWEAVEPDDDENLKGGAMYRKDRQAILTISSMMPIDVQQR